MGSLFEELKRRNVFKVGAAYAVIAFVLAQVAQLALETFGTPDWVLQTIVLLLGLGFPIALVLAWAYELTPGGIKSDAAVRTAGTTSNSTDRNLIFAVLGLLVLLGGFQVVDRFTLTPTTDVGSSAGANFLASAAGRQVTRSSIILGELQAPPGFLNRTKIALSPDGSRLVYAAFEGDGWQLYLREMNGLHSIAIGEKLNYSFGSPELAFAPDNERLLFSHEDGAKLMSVSADNSRLISEIGEMGYWESADTVVLVGTLDRALVRQDLNSGNEHSLNAPLTGDDYQMHPVILPGGETLLVSRFSIGRTGPQDFHLDLVDLATGATTRLIEDAYHAVYTQSRHIVFTRDGALWALPFDLNLLEGSGPAAIVIEDVSTGTSSATTIYALSDNGRLVYLPATTASEAREARSLSSLTWVDRNGVEQRINVDPQVYDMPRISPDATQFAVGVVSGSGEDIFTYDIERGVLSRLSFTSDARFSVWSSEGDRIAYNTGNAMWWIATNGSGEPVRLSSTGGLQNPQAFSPNDEQLLYLSFSNTGGAIDISVLEMHVPEDQAGAGRQSYALLNDDFVERAASLSTDGRWIAYTSNETGIFNVFVRSFPNINQVMRQISYDGGLAPRWSADGSELFYSSRGEDGTIQMHSVPVETDTGFSVGRDEVLFAGEYGANWDVSPDGQTFLMLKHATTGNRPGAGTTSLVLIDNWFEELNRLAPANTQ